MQLELDIHPELVELRQLLGTFPEDHEDAKLAREVMDFCIFRDTDPLTRRHIAVMFCRIVSKKPRPPHNIFPLHSTNWNMLHKLLKLDHRTPDTPLLLATAKALEACFHNEIDSFWSRLERYWQSIAED